MIAYILSVVIDNHLQQEEVVIVDFSAIKGASRDPPV